MAAVAQLAHVGVGVRAGAIHRPTRGVLPEGRVERVDAGAHGQRPLDGVVLDYQGHRGSTSPRRVGTPAAPGQHPEVVITRGPARPEPAGWSCSARPPAGSRGTRASARFSGSHRGRWQAPTPARATRMQTSRSSTTHPRRVRPAAAGSSAPSDAAAATARKPRTNSGKALRPDPADRCDAPDDASSPAPRTTGAMRTLRVSLTIVAIPPAPAVYPNPAATTCDVSPIAVPAHIP